MRRAAATSLSVALVAGLLASMSATAEPPPGAGPPEGKGPPAGAVPDGKGPAALTCTHYGTEGDDSAPGPEIPVGMVYCALGGNDSADRVKGVFIGGPGDDTVYGEGVSEGGTFDGGAGDDRVLGTMAGTFIGGDGNDGLPMYDGVLRGTFDGGAGDDYAVRVLANGVFSGGKDADCVSVLSGYFDGGSGTDGVDSIWVGGTTKSVELVGSAAGACP